MKSKTKTYPKDIEVTITIRRERNKDGKKRYFIKIGKTRMGAMHDFGPSPNIGIEMMHPILHGYKKESIEECRTVAKHNRRYVADFVSTPQNKRPGSTKFWYIHSNENQT